MKSQEVVALQLACSHPTFSKFNENRPYNISALRTRPSKGKSKTLESICLDNSRLVIPKGLLGLTLRVTRSSIDLIRVNNRGDVQRSELAGGSADDMRRKELDTFVVGLTSKQLKTT